MASDPFTGSGAMIGSWTQLAGTMARVGGEAQASAATAFYAWNADVFSADLTTDVTVGVTTANLMIVFARLDATFSNGYSIEIVSSGEVRLERDDAGVGTALETLTGQDVSPGQKWGLRSVGNFHRLIHNDVLVGTGVTDSTYPSAGNSAIALFDTTMTLQEWSCNNFVAPTGHPTVRRVGITEIGRSGVSFRPTRSRGGEFVMKNGIYRKAA